jgi:hypothetical protein
VTLPKPFPYIDISEDYNPAIRLFGNRLISEQTILEYATEFLAIVFSEKKIASETTADPIPTLQMLKKWTSGQSLKYKPPIKLNLKLFAFFGLSRIDGKHEVHEQHYRYLIRRLGNAMTFNRGSSDQVLDYLDDFLRGFQGAGFNRAWCAQTFYPISPSLLTQETIWNETVANRDQPNTWGEVLNSFKKYFSVSKHRFMARGGEILYLQLCNVFRMNKELVQSWADRFELKDDERDLKKLHSQLTSEFMSLKGNYNSSLDQLVDFLEGLDSKTHEKTNDEKYWLEGGWCPEESWPEGYLFAVELKRILTATLDPVERIDLLMTGCAMQVLRTICAQSVRHGAIEIVSETPLGYEWIFSASTSSPQQRQTSQRSLQYIQGIIQKALRKDELQANASKHPRGTYKVKALYQEADNKYGFKLLVSLGKKLGIIVPNTGPGARFIMTDKLLRYLVISLVSPGDRITYQDFLQRMYLHYSIAIEGVQLANAMRWSGLPNNSAMQETKKAWLTDMLSAGGFLTELSDAWSVVKNPFGRSQDI